MLRLTLIFLSLFILVILTSCQLSNKVDTQDADFIGQIREVNKEKNRLLVITEDKEYWVGREENTNIKTEGNDNLSFNSLMPGDNVAVWLHPDYPEALTDPPIVVASKIILVK
jgi:hypothetical protein